MSAAGDNIYVGVPVSLPGAEIVPGSSRRDADCGHRVWVSPAGAERLRSESFRVLCTRCVRALLEEGLPFELGALSEQQLAELTPEGRALAKRLGTA